MAGGDHNEIDHAVARSILRWQFGTKVAQLVTIPVSLLACVPLARALAGKHTTLTITVSFVVTISISVALGATATWLWRTVKSLEAQVERQRTRANLLEEECARCKGELAGLRAGR